MIHVAVFEWGDDGGDGVEFALFKRAVCLPLSWRERIKHAWYALRGDLWTNEVILEPSEVAELRDHLAGILQAGARGDRSGDEATPAPTSGGPE